MLKNNMTIKDERYEYYCDVCGIRGGKAVRFKRADLDLNQHIAERHEFEPMSVRAGTIPGRENKRAGIRVCEVE